MEKVYVVGHLKPDTDTVVSAMAMAAYLNRRHGTDIHVPARTGQLNAETEYVFSRFGADKPELLETGEGRKFWLVDHNEEKQRLPGMDPGMILGIVDHHRFDFKCPNPLEITAKPWGSTATIICWLFEKDGFEIPQELKPLLLSAILSDTVILRSPTTTDMDRKYVESLSSELGINYEELGMEMFKAKASLAGKSAKEIITTDFKDFDMSGRKVGIGQVETPDISMVMDRAEEILSEMENMRSQGYHTVVLMVTDILKQGSVLLVSSEEEDRVASAFSTTISNGRSEFLEGVMSRKKQVVPALEKAFS